MTPSQRIEAIALHGAHRAERDAFAFNYLLGIFAGLTARSEPVTSEIIAYWFEKAKDAAYHMYPKEAAQ